MDEMRANISSTLANILEHDAESKQYPLSPFASSYILSPEQVSVIVPAVIVILVIVVRTPLVIHLLSLLCTD